MDLNKYSNELVGKAVKWSLKENYYVDLNLDLTNELEELVEAYVDAMGDGITDATECIQNGGKILSEEEQIEEAKRRC